MAKPKREVAYMKIVITKEVYEKIEKFKEDNKGDDVKEVWVVVQTGENTYQEIGGTMSEFLRMIGLHEADKALKSNAR